MRPTRTVLIRRGLSGARLACACALQTSRGQAQATAVFPSHTANVAEGSAAGYELEVVLSPRIAIRAENSHVCVCERRCELGGNNKPIPTRVV